MFKNKNTKWALVMCLGAALLSGCGEDKPSDKLAAETVRKYTDQYTGFEVADYKRENGWVDESSANRYKVRYAYNLRLTKPYPEAVLANAKEMVEERKASLKKEGSSFFDANKLQNSVEGMQVTMVANKWAQDQGGNFEKRLNSFLASCAPCAAYWSSVDAPDERRMRRELFIISWMNFEQMNFKDDAKVGDSVPRTAWAAFTKTEKGWRPVE